MSETKILIYNMDLMDDIIANYQSGSDKVQEIITELDDIKKQLLISYEGHAVDLVDDVFSKVREHFELLDSVLIQTEQYVAYAKDSMQELDKTQTGWISKGGGLSLEGHSQI